MRLIHKILHSKETRLLDDIKEGNHYYGYSLGQALDRYGEDIVNSLIDRNLAKKDSGIYESIFLLYPTELGNKIGRTVHERSTAGKMMQDVAIKTLLPVASGVFLAAALFVLNLS